MDRFTREPHHDGFKLKILSTCVLCGAKIVGSSYDETLQAQERGHRKTCGSFLHSLTADGIVAHSTCVKCGLRIQAKIGLPMQQMEEEHLRQCSKRAAAESA